MFFIAGMPPYVAHVPTATTAAALGASRSSHSFIVIGWPLSGFTANPVQCPSPLISSLPSDPSITSTNGSSSPFSASNHACAYSWPTA